MATSLEQIVPGTVLNVSGNGRKIIVVDVENVKIGAIKKAREKDRNSGSEIIYAVYLKEDIKGRTIVGFPLTTRYVDRNSEDYDKYSEILNLKREEKI